MPVDPSAPGWGAGAPPEDWLALVNRQALAVRLIATTVHDVNNILQVVSGAAEVLALDPTPAAVAKRTTSIVGQSAAATAVLQALTGFVRAESDARDGARLLGLASQALTFRQHAFRKARLSASATGDDVEAAMPRHRVLQVLLNLVLNAEQALAGRSDGTIRVEVTGEGDVVTAVVTDNGPGLPADADPAGAWPPRQGATPGSLGLGLLVSRQLLARAGGTLVVAAAPGGGTQATVTLPALRR